MNKTKAKPSTDEGWAVHFYDSDRHLRFTLEPSHIWAFCWGTGVGLLVAIVWYALYSASHSLSRNTEHLTSLAPNSETRYLEGLYPESDSSFSSFPFGID